MNDLVLIFMVLFIVAGISYKLGLDRGRGLL